jgi:ferrochelatase
MAKIAVVLFNMGGPDSLESVRPFLLNLFSDPAIIRLPGPLRRFVARMITRRRTPAAREIYRQMGGKSPILEQTRAQADGLQTRLAELGEVRVFIAMRYWHPMSDFTIQDVRDFGPDRVVLLPLYPQFSTTTSESSTIDWFRAAIAAGVSVPTVALCCYPNASRLIAVQAELIQAALAQASRHGKPRLLLSAHGLPKKIVARGDPYQWQVEQTAARIVETLDTEGLDWAICYQSRVGPLEWLEPSTDIEVRRAGRDGVPLVVAPIAFVSEHSETLVELDIEYRRMAEDSGVPHYARVPTVGVHEGFIECLAELVGRALQEEPQERNTLCSADGDRLCPESFRRCPLAALRH